MKIIFDHSVQDAPHLHSYYFKPESKFSYTAGQFVELTLDHKHPDSRGTKRWFTLSSSPSDDIVSITTRQATDNPSSFKLALKRLEPGDDLHMSDPMGDFVLPKLVQTPLIFIAGGIGITPYLSMLRWLAVTKESRDINLLWAVEREKDIGFQDIFEAAKQHATIVVNQPTSSWGGLRGFLTPDVILGIEDLTKNTLIYVSGAEKMVESLHEGLIRLGVNKNQLVGDYFPGY